MDIVKHLKDSLLLEEQTTIIGRGERVVLDILKFLFPTKSFFIQVKLTGLVAGRLPKDWPPLSQRQMKETIDIVMATEKAGKISDIIALRVQDEHHKGRGYAKHDVIQAEILEACKIKVCDFNWYECVDIWKDKVNVATVEEIIENLRLFKIIEDENLKV
jgi:hypothetical protein